MELADGPSGYGPEGLPGRPILSVDRVARQLGHPPAALAGGAGGEPLVEYSWGGATWPQLDSATLTYSEPMVFVETALRQDDPQPLDEAARGALSGFRLNVELEGAAPQDIDERVLRILAEGADLAAHGDAPPATIEGTEFARVVVNDGVYQAWALHTDKVRVTVAARRENLESVQLRWWRPARTQ